MAAAAITRDDGVEIDLVSELDPDLLGASPSFFSELPLFEPGLTERTGSRALGYVGIGEIGPTLGGLLSRAGQANQGLAVALQRLAAQLRKEAGVDPLGELLPALGGQAALIAEPTDGVPFASLIVDGVDEDAASEALARLQRPVLRALGAGGGGSVPRFEEEEVEGTTVRSIQLNPTVNLSYAVFDGMLVVSTDPAGIAQARSDGDRLAGSEAFEAATDDLPDEVSALVFLNLDELLGQVGRTDLVEDPFFASLSVNLDNIRSAALAVEGSDHRIRSELFMALDD